MSDEKCILCGFALDERTVVVSEGKLCNDSMGCRRRALAQRKRSLLTLSMLIGYTQRFQQRYIETQPAPDRGAG